jgi:hypothetical protein
VKLFISGKGEFAKKSLTPTMQRVKKLLDESKDGELFTAQKVANVLNCSFKTIQGSNTFDSLPGYSHRIVGNSLRYWGKPATIKQLIKETK